MSGYELIHSAWALSYPHLLTERDKTVEERNRKRIKKKMKTLPGRPFQSQIQCPIAPYAAPNPPSTADMLYSRLGWLGWRDWRGWREER